MKANVAKANAVTPARAMKANAAKACAVTPARAMKANAAKVSVARASDHAP
jgi:hypothetical protein